MLNNGGIIHMAASDIFNHIEKDLERIFLVRVSFIEIYNEEVRDLLVTDDSENNAILKIREDKDRGVFVNSNESIVTSMDSLLSVLFAGEKNRTFAATAMNERSSRSHTIFRITVESRLKGAMTDGEDCMKEDSDDDDLQRDNAIDERGAVRISTLNLVDLAGSESVCHTGATGDRQKEGGMINQSLLSLSRVIVCLGQNATHVNFRDSKLTRILQPSLSGNARMAVICCATPSELYLEETRSTLQFASRAKLVKTRAQVNEIMDDRSLLKKLQRVLNHERDSMEQMKALKEKAANAEYANRKADDDLKRMNELILKRGVLGKITASGSAGKQSRYSSLFVYKDDEETIQAGAVESSLSNSAKGIHRRCYDGGMNHTENSDPQNFGAFSSPTREGGVTKLHAQTEMKLKRTKQAINVMPSNIMTDDIDIGFLRKLLAAKSAQILNLKTKLEEAEKKYQDERGEKELLRMAKQDLASQVSALASDRDFVVIEQDILLAEKDVVISISLENIQQMLDDRMQQALTVSNLQSMVESLQGHLAEIMEEATAKEATASSAISQLSREVSNLKTAKKESEDHATNMEASFGAEPQVSAGQLSENLGLLAAAQDANTKLTSQTAHLQTDIDNITELLKKKELAFEEATATIADENADIKDKLARVELRAADSESLVTSIRNELSKEQREKICVQKKLRALEEQSAAFKVQVFDAKASFEAEAHARLSNIGEQFNHALEQLSESRKEVKLSRETISNLNSNIEQYTKEIDSIKLMASNDKGMLVSKLKEELVQTKLDLSHSEADCLSAKRELESTKEKVDLVKRHEHEKQQNLAAKAKEAIETLKDRLAKAESKPNASEVINNLQAKMKELTQTLYDKEERIKKLEKSKITKSQIARIQKLKVRHVLILFVSPHP